MNVSFRVLVAGVVACLCQVALGQYPVESPGEYVVSGPVVSSPVYYGESGASTGTAVVNGGVYYADAAPIQSVQNIGTVSYNSTVNSGVVNGGGSDILDIVNSKRRRSGLPALMLDAGLEQIAQSKSNIRANRRITGHDNSNRGHARVEGVGYAYGGNLSQRFNTCYLYSNGYSHAGAAIAYDNSGRAYYTLMLR